MRRDALKPETRVPAHARAPLRQAIAAEIDSSDSRLRFTPVLEAQFERDTRARRVRHLLRTTVVALIFYNSFLVADCLTVPDVIPDEIVVQLGVISPLSLLVLAYLPRARHAWRREAAITLVVTLAILGAVGTFWRATGADAGYSSASFALFVVFINVVMRLRFSYALAFSSLTLAAAIPATLLHPGIATGARAQVILCTLLTALATLYANYTIEAGERRNYLMLLRQRIDSDDLADSNAALNAMSTTDWLTGISNRRDFEVRLERAVQHAAATCEPLALAMIDVDHFKAYNDAHGHQAGDTCLAAVAATLGAQLRDGLDTLARYGGEEFTAILPRLDLVGAIMTAERLRRAVEALAMPHTGGGWPAVTVSIGVAVVLPHLDGGLGQLIAEADAALYAAKQRGRNRVHPPLLAAVDDLAG